MFNLFNKQFIIIEDIAYEATLEGLQKLAASVDAYSYVQENHRLRSQIRGEVENTEYYQKLEDVFVGRELEWKKILQIHKDKVEVLENRLKCLKPQINLSSANQEPGEVSGVTPRSESAVISPR